MKNTIIISILFLVSALSFAQVPSAFKYQGVVRNAQNKLVIDKDIQVRIQIVQDYPNGSVQYIERHQVTTSPYGVFSINVFEGFNDFGAFSFIDWSKGPYHLLVEIDLEGGPNFQFMGASEMLSVPYALYGEDADANPNNELQDLEYLGIDSTTNEHLLKLTKSDSMVRIPIDLGRIDLDADPKNEIQTITKAAKTITLNKGGGFVLLLDDSPKNELQKIKKVGNVIELDNDGGKITLKDDDPDNEIQKITKQGNVISLNKNGGNINLNDDDPKNELQKISLVGESIVLSNNGGAVPLKDNDAVNELQELEAIKRSDIVTQNIVTELRLKDKSGNIQSVIIDDTDFTNELQRPILTLREGANGIEGDLNLDKIPGTTPVRLPDLDPTNELQELSLDGTILRLSSGGNVDLKDLGSGTNSSPWEKINSSEVKFDGTATARKFQIPSLELPTNNFPPIQIGESSNGLGGEMIIRGFGKRVNFWSTNIRIGSKRNDPGHGLVEIVDPHEREVVSIYSESMNSDNEGRGIVEADQFKVRQGIITRSPNGKCWMITVDNGGNLKTTQLEGCTFNE